MNILVLRQPDDEFERRAYVLGVLIDAWQQRGARVAVRCGTDGSVDSDAIVIPHLDATRTPASYQQLFDRCGTVLNRRVTDISKRRVSANLVTSASGHDGPVIVKTDRNAGGEPEKRETLRRRKFGRAVLRLARRLPWTVTGLLSPNDYRIYNHPRLVPWAVWHNRRLVVEKFMPERRGDLYCLRQYTFFGSREINTLAVSIEPLVKAWNAVAREVLPEAPPAIRAIRAALGFDFGKFDYVMHDGRPVLLDANRTPTYNAASRAGSPSQLLLDLALGIDAFVPGATATKAAAPEKPLTGMVA